MQIPISVKYKHTQNTFFVEEGYSIARLLRENGMQISSCGTGKCAKCKIISDSIPTNEEIEKLTEKEIAANIRLACYTKAQKNLSIEIPEHTNITVVTHYSDQEYEFSPLVKCLTLDISKPSLDDQRDDLKRVQEESKCTSHTLDIDELANITQKIHQKEVKVLSYNNILIGAAKEKEHLALAVDIGTTTIVASLINLDTKQIIATAGEGNRQAVWGSDIISRINHTIKENNPDYQNSIVALRKVVVEQIDSMLHTLLQKAKSTNQISSNTDDVHYICLTGNTTMLHLFMGLPAQNISRTPFISVFLEAMHFKAKEVGMTSQAHIFTMPCVSAYVGADIVAALLSIKAHEQTKPFILLDLGTNAEIVLGYDNKFISCSTAAGPCFEGACLSCGMGGQQGAISHINFDQKTMQLAFETIENTEAKGICGSGVLDLLALLLETRCIDETGALADNGALLQNLILKNDDGQKEFVLVDNIKFTQKDIREVQLAKAAIRAGIHTLLNEANLQFSDIENLYIAGGFGAAMDVQSAAKIGLIPQELAHCASAIGNGASLGVILYASMENAQKYTQQIVEKTQYIELSALPLFSELYIEHMMFSNE